MYGDFGTFRVKGNGLLYTDSSWKVRLTKKNRCSLFASISESFIVQSETSTNINSPQVRILKTFKMSYSKQCKKAYKTSNSVHF